MKPDKTISKRKAEVDDPHSEVGLFARCLASPWWTNFLDFSPLIAYYTLCDKTDGELGSPDQFFFASFCATACGVLAQIINFWRSCIDDRVSPLRPLDAGQTGIFLLFSLVRFAPPSLLAWVMVWNQALLNVQLVLIVLIGNALGSPFLLPYTREAMKKSQWEDPHIQPLIVQMAKERSFTWFYVFSAMFLFSAVTPVIAEFRQKQWPLGTIIFQDIIQLSIFIGAWVRFVWYDTWELTAPEEDIPECEGLTHEVVTVSGDIASNAVVRQLSAKDYPQAAALLRKALWDDPSYVTWPGIGDLPQAEREQAMEKCFTFNFKQMQRFGHIFGAFEKDGSENKLRAVIACVAAWKGDETESAQSVVSFIKVGWDLPVPDGAEELDEPRKEYLRLTAGAPNGRPRPHLYIWLYGEDPEQSGKGFGRAVLQHALATADARSVVSLLETTTNASRAEFEKAGFKSEYQFEVDGCPDPWNLMVREPPNASNSNYGSL